MKFIFSSLFFLVFSLGFPSLSKIRKTYPLANGDKEVAQKLYDGLSGITTDDEAIYIAYKGGVAAIMAKHAKGVKNKKIFFKEGVSLLEHAIEKAPENIEIRCIRLGVQENSPKFLKYKAQIEADKNFIIEHFPLETSEEIRAFVKGFVGQSSIFNADQKQLF